MILVVEELSQAQIKLLKTGENFTTFTHFHQEGSKKRSWVRGYPNPNLSLLRRETPGCTFAMCTIQNRVAAT